MKNYDNILRDVYIAFLSGIAKKVGDEIFWEDANRNPITIEAIDMERCEYIIRSYWSNGAIKWKQTCIDGLPIGVGQWWWENGKTMCKVEYNGGRRHGLTTTYDSRGRVQSVVRYAEGKLVRK